MRWAKTRTLVFFWLLAAATYFIIPAVTPFATRAVPTTGLDALMPFFGGAVIIYITLYAHHAVSFFAVPSRPALRVFFTAYLVGVALTSAAYFFLPTVHPLSFTSSESFFASLVQSVKTIDVAENVFPSGHVFFSMMPGFFFMAFGNKKMGLWLGGWGVLIAASALLIRQHGIIDVGTGLLLALVVGTIFGRMARLREAIIVPAA